MYSLARNRCTHLLGSPIRTSPDLRLLASPRGFSQLATSFFAYLRLGIPTHALSSLTIKLTSYTVFREDRSLQTFIQKLRRYFHLCFYARQIFNCQRSIFFLRSQKPGVRRQKSGDRIYILTSDFRLLASRFRLLYFSGARGQYSEARIHILSPDFCLLTSSGGPG